MRAIESDKHESFYTAGQLKRCDGSQDGALNGASAYHLGSVNIFNHANRVFVGYPRVSVRVLEIHGGVVYSFRHIAKVNAQHSSSQGVVDVV